MAFTNNADPSRIGQINLTGDNQALFNKIFNGEVLTNFENACVTKDKFDTRTLTKGKASKFDMMGDATAKYHVAGQSLIEGDNGYLNKIAHSEKLIYVDDMLTASTVVAEIDELKNEYDVRAGYSSKLGNALAQRYDKNSLQMAVLAARLATPLITGGRIGDVLTKGATVATSGTVLAAAIFEAAQKFDEKNVPESERFCFLRPAQYSLLAQTTGVINKDWGGSGVYADGTVLKIGGVTLIKTNNLPGSVISANTGERNTYNGDFTDTVAVVTQRAAIGTVKLKDISFESAWDIERQITLMVAKMAVGHGIVRPECAVEISKA